MRRSTKITLIASAIIVTAIVLFVAFVVHPMSVDGGTIKSTTKTYYLGDEILRANADTDIYYFHGFDPNLVIGHHRYRGFANMHVLAGRGSMFRIHDTTFKITDLGYYWITLEVISE